MNGQYFTCARGLPFLSVGTFLTFFLIYFQNGLFRIVALYECQKLVQCFVLHLMSIGGLEDWNLTHRMIPLRAVRGLKIKFQILLSVGTSAILLEYRAVCSGCSFTRKWPRGVVVA